jgi:NADP-dependent 3-hydroxy acid dehydrogenase YdfG
MKKIVCISGATSGIGKASAWKFARNNYDLIITGRRENLLEELKNQLIRNALLM